MSSGASAQTYGSRQGFYIGIGQSLTATDESHVKAVIQPGGIAPITLSGTLPDSKRAALESDAYTEKSPIVVAGFDFRRNNVTWAIEAVYNTGKFAAHGISDQLRVTPATGNVSFSDNFAQISGATLTDSIEYDARLEHISIFQGRLGTQITERLTVSGFLGIAAAQANLNLYQSTQVEGVVIFRLGATPVIITPVTRMLMDTTSTDRRTLLGVHYGTGFDFRLDDKYAVRGEGSVTRFEKLGLALQPTLTDPTRLTNVPTVRNITLSLVRRF